MGNVKLQQPQPFDLVGDPILVAGLSVAFEATVQWVLSDGHAMLSGFFTGGGATSVRQFQTNITGVAGTDMKQALMFLTLFTVSAEDGSRRDVTTVPLIYGPLLIDGFEGYRTYTVRPGDTLSGIAAAQYGDASRWPMIHTANQHLVPNANLIFVGQQLRIPIGS
jgi:nucleoid-associated protein YgaU